MSKILMHFGLLVVNLLPASWLIKMVTLLLGLGNYRKQVINKNYKFTNIDQHYKGSESEFYKKSIANIARVIIESIKPITKRRFSGIKFFGVKRLNELATQTNGVLLLASHYGNWELACSLLPMKTDLPVYGVYKPLKNTVADQLILERRSKYGLILVPMRRIGRVILENKRNQKPAIYILISDQNPNSKNSIVWANFLGIRSAFFNGPLKLWKKYNFNVAYLKVEPGSSIYNYDVDVSRSISSGSEGSELIQNYASLLEDQIIDDPHYWLWSHKRWKRNF